MNIEDFLEKCRDIGIELYSENSESLSYKAEKGLMTNEIMQYMKDHKPEIILHLRKDEKTSHALDMEAMFKKFPLTDIQSAYFSGRNPNYTLGGTSCYTYIELKTTAIDNQKLEKAWHQVIEKHDMLRAIITDDGMQKIQEIVEMPELKTIYVNLKTGIENSDEVKDIRKKLSFLNFEIGKWPMHKLLLSTNNNESIIHFCIDMIIADYISINKIIEDLEHFYNHGKEEVGKADTTFREFVVNKQRNEKQYLKSKDYWMNKIKNIEFDCPNLQIDFTNKNTNQKVEFKRLKYSLSEMESLELKKRASSHNVTVSNSILATYLKTIRTWSENKNFCINVTLMERPDGFEDVVGDFTSVNVLNINDIDVDFKSFARIIQEELIRDLSHASFSGVEVLREINRNRKEKLIIPIVYTSTLGQGGNSRGLAYKVINGISRTPQVLIDCQVMENNGQITIHWDYRVGEIKEEIILEMFDFFIKEIDKILNKDESWHDNINTGSSINANFIGINSEVDIPCDEEKSFLEKINQKSEEKIFNLDNYEISYQGIYRYVYATISHFNRIDCSEDYQVVYLGDNRFWQFVFIIAGIISGRKVTLICSEQPYLRIQKMIDSIRLKQVFIDQNLKKHFSNLSFESIENINLNELDFKFYTRQEEPSLSIFTSGDSQNPLERTIKYNEFLKKFHFFKDMFNLNSNDRVFVKPNIQRGYGVYEILFGLYSGAKVTIPDDARGLNPIYWIQLIRKYEINILFLLRQDYVAIIDELQRTNSKLSNIKYVYIFGDALSQEEIEKSTQIVYNCQLIHINGELEYGLWSSYFNYKDLPITDGIYFGKPVLEDNIVVLDKNYNQNRNWMVGEIYALVPTLNCGYRSKKNILTDKDNDFTYTNTSMLGYRTDQNEIIILRPDINYVEIDSHRFNKVEIEENIKKFSGVEECDVQLTGDTRHPLLATILPKENEYTDKKELGECIENLRNTCNEYFEEIDEENFLEWKTASDMASISDILKMLKKSGVFSIKKKIYTEADIFNLINPQQEFQNTINKMIDILEKEGLILKNEKGYILTSKSNYYEENEDLWAEVYKLSDELNYGKELIKYQKKSGDKLLEQLRGEIKGIELFFPQASTRIAEDAYRDNIINSRLNKCVLKVVESIKRPTLNILEIGAGVGGTTDILLEALYKNKVDCKYCFTDISNYFLNGAKNKYKEIDFVEYRILDINKDYISQGFLDNEFDVIICANVLHNSINIEENLYKINRLLKSDGCLIIIEATKESYSLVTSLELKGGFGTFTDHRKNSNDIFTSYDKWIDLITMSGFKNLFSVPDQKKKISECGQTLFICQKNSINNKVDIQEIESYLEKHLPKYMNPTKYKIIDKGKEIERNNLNKDQGENINIANIKCTPNTEIEGLEYEILNIWKKLIGNEQIKSEDNFYYVGGDSLILAQTVSEMKNTIDLLAGIEWDDLMNMALNNSTVKTLSKAIEDQINTTQYSVHEDKTLDDNCIVKFKEAKNKIDRVYAFFHAGTGRLIDYESLIPELINKTNKNESIVGFTYGDYEQYLSIPCEELIDTRTQIYSNHLDKMNAKDYCLIGYCVGGYLAIETAIKLKKTNKKISKVILISSEPCTHNIYNQLLLEYAYGQAVGLDMTKAGYNINDELFRQDLEKIINGENRNIKNSELISDKNRYKDIFIRLIDYSHEERLRKIFDEAGGTKFNGEDSTFSMFKILYDIFEHTFKAMMKYDLNNNYDGLVISLVAPVLGSFFPKLSEKNDIEEIILGELIKIKISGNHATCLNENNIQDVLTIILNEGKNDL